MLTEARCRRCKQSVATRGTALPSEGFRHIVWVTCDPCDKGPRSETPEWWQAEKTTERKVG